MSALPSDTQDILGRYKAAMEWSTEPRRSRRRTTVGSRQIRAGSTASLEQATAK